MSISTRRLPVAILACAALALALPALAAATKDKKEKPSDAKPELVATYGDWSVYQSQSGKNRICYALATPKTRDPEDMKREAGYAFISERPAEQVRNEVSFVMGFDIATQETAKETHEKPKETHDKQKKKNESEEQKAKAKIAAPTATVGDSEFELLPKGTDLWVKNAAKESQLIDEMRRGAKLEIHATSKKGEATVDTYSLTGFKQAIDRALKDCPGA